MDTLSAAPSLASVAREGFSKGLNTAEIADLVTASTGEDCTEAAVVAALMGPVPVPEIPKPPRKPSRQIIAEVAAKHHVRADQIVGVTRSREVVRARCEAMRAVAAEWPNLSYPVLGRIFNRDHTTAMYHLPLSGGHRHCRCAENPVTQ